MLFEPHSKKQDDVIFSDADLTIGATGIQWGKSKAGSIWLKRHCHTYTDPTDNFIMCAPTHKIMRQSCLPAFLSVMKGCGVHNKSEAEFKIHGGGTVFLRTGTDPDSIVGITNVRAIYGDEAGKYSLYFWENIQGRSAFFNCPVLLTTSPYTLNWMYKDIILPFMKGKKADELKRNELKIVQAASIENPYFNKKSYEKQRQTMDPMRFNMLYGGEWGRMDGLVYKCWDDQENQIDEADLKLPKGTRFFGNIDWGYTHPCHIGIRAITPDKTHIKLSEYHYAGKTISDIKEQCKRYMTVWPIELFFCGPDQPGNIDELNRAGIPAVKANNDVRLGIDRHYELIQTRRFKVVRGKCPHTIDGIDTYHYHEPKDLGADDDDKERNPVKQDDDAVDSDRYGTIETYDLTNLPPRVIKEKLDPLFKSGVSHTERW